MAGVCSAAGRWAQTGKWRAGAGNNDPPGKAQGGGPVEPGPAVAAPDGFICCGGKNQPDEVPGPRENVEPVRLPAVDPGFDGEARLHGVDEAHDGDDEGARTTGQKETAQRLNAGGGEAW